jgi:pimeloyl-ACP methyl ester carboxylesterase
MVAASWIVLSVLAATPPVEPEPAAAFRAIEIRQGESLSIAESGKGEKAIVLVPGLFGSIFSYRHVIPLLTARGYRTVAVEPLGVGDSGRPRDADYSLTAQADRIAEVMAALQIESAVLVGHGVSASMVLRVAYRHPQRVRGLVLIEGGPTETAVTPSFRRAMKLAPLLKLLGKGFIRGRVRGQLKERAADPRWVTDEIVDGYTRGAARDLGATFHVLKRMGDPKEPELLTPRLHEIRCRVVLLLGAAPHDGAPPAAHLELLSRRLPAFNVERIPDAGYFIFEERPEAVAAAIVGLIGADPPHPAAD